jgi:hypothetical protein
MAVGHMAALEPTSVGRCGPKLPLLWQRVDIHTIFCLDLELVCGVSNLQVPTTSSIAPRLAWPIRSNLM